VAKGFLDDTDDEDEDVDEGEYIIACLSWPFHYSECGDVPTLRVLGLASLAYCDGASASSTSLEVDAKQAELYISLPQVNFNSLGDCEVLEGWKNHQFMFPNLIKTARQFLALPSASDGVERLFIASG
jgi:hypothetical protein